MPQGTRRRAPEGIARHPVPERVLQSDPDPREGHFRDGTSRLTVGSVRCQCAQCSQWFGGLITFDLHHAMTTHRGVLCVSDDALHPEGRRPVTRWWVRAHLGIQNATGTDDGGRR